MPADLAEKVPVTPHCQQCYDEYEEDGFTVKRRTCNKANWYSNQSDCESGIIPSNTNDFGNYEYKWTTEECNYAFKQHIIKETPSTPQPLPKNWRVTSSGHLTNLPTDLDVTDRTNALKNGVAVIAPISIRHQHPSDETELEDYDLNSQPIINPSAWNATIEYGEALPLFQGYMPCVWTELEDSGSAEEYGVVTENDCANESYILWSYNPVTQQGGTLQGVIDYLTTGGSAEGFSLNNLDKQYWWLESPLFTAACPDKNYTEYTKPEDANGVTDYWDNTACINSTSKDEEEGMAIPWAIVGAVGLLGAVAYGANMYLGSTVAGGAS